MKSKYLILLLLGSISLFAQRTGTFNINNLRAEVCDNGSLFQNYNVRNRLTVNNTGGQCIMFEAQLWFAANAGSNTYTALQTDYVPQSRPLSTSDYSAGPVSNDYTDPNYTSRYQRIWQVRKSDIDYHITHFQDPGYRVHSVIEDWPAHGDTNRGEAFNLAPFHDFNGNGLYEPTLGDYPLIRGDEAIYIIYNDEHRTNPNTDNNGLGLEIHMMLYAFDEPSQYHLFNSLFLYYRVINRSNRTYENFHSNFYKGITLGNPNDDLIGSDSTRAMIYTYNLDTIDPGWGAFGAYPGSVTVFDPESIANRAMLHHTTISDVDTNASYPRNKTDYYNFNRGLWKDGTPLRLDNPSGLLDTNNGSGYQTSPPFGPISQWAFNDQVNWYNNPNFRYLPTMLLGRMDENFGPGDSICWNLTIAYANDSSDANPYAPVVRLKAKVDSLTQFFQNQNYNCSTYELNLEKDLVTEYAIYPQPASALIHIEGPHHIQKFRIFNLNASLELEGEVLSTSFDINCESLKPGVYILNLELESGELVHRKILIQ